MQSTQDGFSTPRQRRVNEITDKVGLGLGRPKTTEEVMKERLLDQRLAEDSIAHIHPALADKINF